MDFNKIINKIRELDAPATKKVVTESVQVVAEKAKSKAQQKFMGMVYANKKGGKAASPEVAKAAKGMSKKSAKDFAATKHKGKPEHVDESEEDLKVGDSKKTSTGGTVTKTKTGLVHKAGKNYSGKAAEKEAKSVKEEMKVGDKKKTSTGGTLEKTKTGVKHTAGKNYSGKAAEKEVKEGAKPDFLDVDKDGNKKEPFKKAVADKKKNPFGNKKKVKESFVSLLQVVKESKGTKLIEAVDKELFAWAERVGKSKFSESAKAEAFAAVTYERMGGTFKIYDTLSEGK
jgi:hypothetical protein